MRHVIALLILTGILSVSPPAMAVELKLHWDKSNLSMEQKELLNTILGNLIHVYDEIDIDWDLDRVHTAQMDLNDDGVDEFFVSYPNTFFCYGNSGDCPVSIYKRKKSNWIYIGQIDALGGEYLTVSDERYEGWRVLLNEWQKRSDHRYRYCWSYSIDTDMFMTPHSPYGPGYGGGHAINEPCPKR